MSSEFWTIGYEKADIDDFIATLKIAGITMIIDVRDIPISRRRGFSKSALQDRLFKNDIKYVHLKELGTPKAGRVAAKKKRFGEFKKIFGAQFASEKAQAALIVAMDHIRTQNACFLCYEKNSKECHRSIVGERIVDATGWTIEHLRVPDGIGKTWKTTSKLNALSSSSKRRPNPASDTKKQFVVQA